jgi:hypothetical protein
MPITDVLLSTGDQVAVEGTVDQVVKLLEDAARSSAGTLARLPRVDTDDQLAVNVAHVVAVRPGGD